MKEHLKLGEVEAIEAVIRALEHERAADYTPELPFWDRHRDRLRYRQFRQRGLPIGSGAVESAVGRVIDLRMKGASVVWTEEHAEGILHLRAHAKSGRWDELEHAVLQDIRWRPTSRLLRPKKAT